MTILNNKQIALMCQKAGIIDVEFDEHLPPPDNIYFKFDDENWYSIIPGDDEAPGSALFVVAVLKSLDVSVMIGRSMDGFRITWKKIIPDEDFINSETKKWTVESYSTHWHKTLTAACMDAIVRGNSK